MKTILAIGTGSFIGGVLRYLLSLFIQSKVASAFPFATLSVNLVGCLLIGVVFGLSEKINFHPDWRIFLATGLLGGFTTFSAFSNETFLLIRNGAVWNAAVYVMASVFLGIIATWIGYSLMKPA